MPSRHVLGLILLTAVGTVMLRGDDAPSEAPPRSVRKRLDGTLSVELRRTPLYEALDEIGKSVGLTILLDGNALKQSGYTRNMAQTHRFENVASGEAITTIVKKYPGMTFVVDEIGNRVVVTTADGAKRVQPPVADGTEWRERISAEQLAGEIRSTRRELGKALASVREWRSRKAIDRAAGRLAWLFQLAGRHPEGLPPTVAADLATASIHLQAATRSKAADARETATSSFETIESTLQKHSESINSPNGETKMPPIVLVDIMPRLERALKTLDAAAEQGELPAVARDRLAGEAALASAAGRLVVDAGAYAGEAEFRAHAEGLSADFTTTRKSIEKGNLDGTRAALSRVVKRCTACHQSFR